ncbi:unnamed protein product [Symbiodinium necroappetens]|uniref:Uncharacterized protein n=1 Tax=Symbiodinium necroappetens TaxID=1628268 RepID=A0A812QUH8_9DINO|nr:unnamed protein product [Symbiodinium necroappetens]
MWQAYNHWRFRAQWTQRRYAQFEHAPGKHANNGFLTRCAHAQAAEVDSSGEMDTGCLQLIRDGDGVNSIVIAKYRLDSKVKAQTAGPASFTHLTTEADANTPSSGIFWNPSQTVEHACLNFGAMLSELFLISKALMPRELQKELVRLDELHGSTLLDPVDTNTRSLQNQAQGVLNMMSFINTKRRNMKDGSRIPDGIKRLIECSCKSPPN